MQEQFVLSLPMKPLCGDGVPGAVPGVRHEPEPRHVRLQAGRGTIPRLAALRELRTEELRAEADRETEDDAESKTTTFQDADGQAPDARRAEAGGLSECPHCHEPKPPHHVCANCGYYRGRQVARGRRRVARPEPSSNPEPCLNPMIWIAVDAMGGDVAPRPRRRRRAGRGARTSISAWRSSGRRAALEAELGAASRTSTAARVRDRRRARRRRRWPSRRRRRCGASRGASIRVAAEAVARGDAAALFSAGHTGATVMAAHARVRHAARRRSAGAGRDDSDAPAARRPARRRRQRRVPAAAPAAVRGDGQRLRARRARHRRAARRAAVDRRGSDARATS